MRNTSVTYELVSKCVVGLTLKRSGPLIRGQICDKDHTATSSKWYLPEGIL